VKAALGRPYLAQVNQGYEVRLSLIFGAIADQYKKQLEYWKIPFE